MLTPNPSLNRTPTGGLPPARRSPVSSRPEVVCQLFFASPVIEASSGEPRRWSALR
jgi:hypothetical protein